MARHYQLDQVLFNQGDYASGGHLAMSQLAGDITGILWEEAKYATKHRTMHRAAPPTKNYQSKISSAKVEKPEPDQAMKVSVPPILCLFLATKSLTIKYAVAKHYLLMMTFLYRSEYKSSHFVCAQQ